MDGDQTTGVDWNAVIQGANDIFLKDYATITGKPIAREQPSSLMGLITGTDYGTSRGAVPTTGGIGGGLIMLAAIAALVYFVAKR